jgi:membrane protease YdiL (CAAX protease family)
MNELNVLDYVLLAALLVVLPARSLWRTWSPRRTKSTMAQRTLRTLLIAFGLLSVLAANWALTGRSVASLGLALPASTYEYGLLGLAVVILGVLGGAMLVHKPAAPKRMEESEAWEKLPKTLQEFRLFVLAAFGLGFGWEVLYRAYLLFALEPVTGTVAAVAIAAMSYAVGHGDKNVRQFAGSVIAAFAFTIAFAVSGSLWWLVLLHAGLPLLAATHSWRIASSTAQ